MGQIGRFLRTLVERDPETARTLLDCPFEVFAWEEGSVGCLMVEAARAHNRVAFDDTFWRYANVYSFAPGATWGVAVTTALMDLTRHQTAATLALRVTAIAMRLHGRRDNRRAVYTPTPTLRWEQNRAITDRLRGMIQATLRRLLAERDAERRVWDQAIQSLTTLADTLVYAAEHGTAHEPALAVKPVENPCVAMAVLYDFGGGFTQDREYIRRIKLAAQTPPRPVLVGVS